MTADATDSIVQLVQVLTDRISKLEKHNRRLVQAGNALDACIDQFGDIGNWTHDDAFMYVEEARTARARWKEVTRG